MRGAVYIDGFNLYHAIDDLGKPYLKWNNLRTLSELLSGKRVKSIDKIEFFTAFFSTGDQKHERHRKYLAAQEMNDVIIRKGHLGHEDRKCISCGNQWKQPKEKQSDVMLALSVFEDALNDVYDIAFLITADSDQLASIKAVKRVAPGKKIVIVTPAGRAPSNYLDSACDDRIRMSEDHLDRSVFDGDVSDGKTLICRPATYDPPLGWKHPSQRIKV